MFEDALIRQIRYALSSVDGEFDVTKESGRIYVKALGEYDYDDTIEALSVYLVSQISAQWCRSTIRIMRT